MPKPPRAARSILGKIGTAALTLAQVLAMVPDLGINIAQLGGGGEARPGVPELKLSTWLPKAHPIAAAIDNWADSIEDGKQLTTAIYSGDEALGKASEQYDLVRDGIADFALVNPSLQPGRFPIVSVGDLPFQFRDGRSGTGALDAWYRKYAAHEMKDVHFCFAVVQNPGTLHSRRPVLIPEDIKGLTLQSVNATVPLTVLLGGTNAQAPAANIRDLIDRGKLDGVFASWGSELLGETSKTLKYHIDVPFYASTYVWVMSKQRYDGLSAAQKRKIDDHCTNDWAVRFASSWADAESAGREKLMALPGEVVETLNPAQLAEWRKATEPLYANWSTALNIEGTDPDEAYRELESSMAIYHADY
jgi:TRAP-type C4-dicarboxylate transport system substrate-binding protein